MPPIDGERAQRAIVLAERVRTLPGSAIRALLASARTNDPLDLGGGIPDLTLFPREDLARVAGQVLDGSTAEALQYAPTQGYLPLREFIAKRLEARGCQVCPDQVIITHGAQQALATVATLLASPEQLIALEQPVYPGAQQAFMLAQTPILPLPVTSDGWQLEALRRSAVTAAYVIPNFQNPTGRKASAEQCLELARIAETSGMLVIEDDAYGELDFAGHPPRPILADAPTRGLLIGSFSKTLCPGLRVGWIVAPCELVDPLQRILQATSLQPGTLAQHLAYGLLRQFDFEAHLRLLRQTYESRANTLWTACSNLGLHLAKPRGGFFLWLETSGQASLAARQAAQAGVLSVPEQAFRHPNHEGPDRHLRLAFSRYLDAPSDRKKLAVLKRLPELDESESLNDDEA